MGPVIHWTLSVRYLPNHVSCTNFFITNGDDYRGRRVLLPSVL